VVCVSQGGYLGTEENESDKRQIRARYVHPDVATIVVYQSSHEMEK